MANKIGVQGDFPTIQAAVNAASDFDTIRVAPRDAGRMENVLIIHCSQT